MKTNKSLLACLLVIVCIAGSCKEKNDYPIVTVIGEQTLVGEIGHKPMTAAIGPPPPGVILCLKTDTREYTLIYNGFPLVGYAKIEDVTYSLDDQVEITGTVSRIQVGPSEEYLELEIDTIAKMPI